MNITLEFSEWSQIEEALSWADDFFEARDEMNAQVHCSPIRYSPITERVMAARAMLVEHTDKCRREFKL
jgi:hypothetical protein